MDWQRRLPPRKPWPTAVDQLSDVDDTAPADGDTFIFDAASGLWKPGPPATPISGASDVTYNNATSGLAATNVQAAIDEVAGLTTSGAWVIVKKTADEVRNSTTTLADDSQLKMNLAANKLYQIRARCFYSIANATMDFKYQWAYSGTVGSAYARRQVYVAGMASGTDNEFIIVNNTFPGVSAPDSSAAGAGYFELTMSLATTGAGVFSLQWAQNTSNAGNYIVLAGSCIEYLAF